MSHINKAFEELQERDLLDGREFNYVVAGSGNPSMFRTKYPTIIESYIFNFTERGVNFFPISRGTVNGKRSFIVPWQDMKAIRIRSSLSFLFAQYRLQFKAYGKKWILYIRKFILGNPVQKANAKAIKDWIKRKAV